MAAQGSGPPRPGNMSPRSSKQNSTITELLQRFDSIQLLPTTEGKKFSKAEQQDLAKKKQQFMNEVKEILVRGKRLRAGDSWSKLYAERAFKNQKVTSPKELKHHEQIVKQYLHIVQTSSDKNSFAHVVDDTVLPTDYLIIVGMLPERSALKSLIDEWEKHLQAKTDQQPVPVLLGDIVVAKVTKTSDFVYARVIAAPENMTYDKMSAASSALVIHIFSKPDEREAVQPVQVLPLSRAMREMVVNQRLEKLVWQWSDQLCGDLTQYIVKDTLRLLNLRDINEEFLKNIYVNKATIFESMMLKRARKKLVELLASLKPSGFHDKMTAYVDQQYAEFMQRDFSDPQSLFRPGAESNIEQLQRLKMSFYNLAENTIQKYIGFCDYGLDEIKLDKRELLNGSIKNEMTQWWLQLIATKVENFVEEKGYDMEAVPYDYLEMPPKDMASVRRNLDIISSLMKELNDPRRCYPIHALIDSLKAQIFPKMDAFISQSEITLMEHFYPDGDRSSIDSFRQFEFQKVKKKFQAQQDSMDQQTRLSIRDMIMDLEYLYEMKALEDTSTSGKLQLGVVPISGIAVGRIHRFENELRTVLERWGHLDKQEKKDKDDEKKDKNESKRDPRKTSVSVFVDKEKKKERPGSVAPEATSHLLNKLEDRVRRMSSASDDKLNLPSKSPTIQKPLSRNESFKETSPSPVSSPVLATPQSSSPLSQSYESGSSQLSPERGKALARHVSTSELPESHHRDESASRNKLMLMQMRSASASEDLGTEDDTPPISSSSLLDQLTRRPNAVAMPLEKLLKEKRSESPLPIGSASITEERKAGSRRSQDMP